MTAAVKICGIMQPEHGLAAVQAGAAYIGLVFAPSRRRVSAAQARSIVEAVREADPERRVRIVGVFVNETPAVINALADELGLDIAQLSGHEPPTDCAAIALPVVKAVRFDRHASEAAWLSDSGDVPEVPLLVDAHVAGSFGGAGVTGDWLAAARIAAGRTVWLAGGLTPLNVAAAIQQVRPAVVDVSSGVETDGSKDTAKIFAFVQAAAELNRAMPARSTREL